MTFSLAWTIVVLLSCASLTGCATADSYTDKPMVEYDSHTSYAVDDTDAGFVLYVRYSRYQFIPESSAVDQAATSQMLSIAHEIADKRTRPIEPINEQRIKKSMGRNGFTGITSWSGMVPATYVSQVKPAK